MWVPITRASLEHIIASTGRADGASDDDPAMFEKRFFVADNATFHFAAVRRVVGQSSVTMTTQSAFKFLGGGPPESGTMHIGFLLSGSMAISLNSERGEPFVPGSVYATSSWRAANLESAGMTRGLDIQIPHERLVERGIRVRRDRIRIDVSNSLANPLRAFALTIADPAWQPTLIGELITERVLEDLVVGLLLESDGYSMGREDLRVELRQRAVDQVAKSHQTAALNPTTLATLLGVSLRHLQRSFEGSGASVSETIKRKRCQSAAVFLAGQRESGLTLAEVAKRSGFQSAAELRSCFRAQYGVLPSEYRTRRNRTSVSVATENTRIGAQDRMHSPRRSIVGSAPVALREDGK